DLATTPTASRSDAGRAGGAVRTAAGRCHGRFASIRQSSCPDEWNIARVEAQYQTLARHQTLVPLTAARPPQWSSSRSAVGQFSRRIGIYRRELVTIGRMAGLLLDARRPRST